MVLMVMAMMLMMDAAVVDGGVGVGRIINKNGCQQDEQDKFFHNIGFNNN